MSQVQELWFTDGNVIFEVEHKSFKLHSGFLSIRSKQFKIIFEDDSADGLLGITRDRNTFESALTIKLPDRSEDMHHFFLALYYDIIPGFFGPPPMIVMTEVMLGIFRTSSKYGVQTLRRRALEHLNIMYPFTLEGWDSRSHGTIQPQSEVYRSFGFSSTFAAAYAIVKIAKEHHAPWILPAAFYDCCGFDVDVILAFFKERLLAHEEEDKDLMTSIIIGALAHKTASIDIFRFLTIAAPEGCLHASSCLEIRRACMEQVSSLFTSNDPLGIWVDEDWNAYLDGMCDICMQRCKAIHHHERQEFWKRLPGTYNQPYKTWAILVNLHNEELCHE